QHVGQLHGNAVTRLQPGVGLEIGSELPGQAVHLAPGDGLAQVGERRLVGKAFAGFLQDCQNIGVRIWIDLGGNTLRILASRKTLLHGAPWLSPIGVVLLFYRVMNSTDLDPFASISLIRVAKWPCPIDIS